MKRRLTDMQKKSKKIIIEMLQLVAGLCLIPSMIEVSRFVVDKIYLWF